MNNYLIKGRSVSSGKAFGKAFLINKKKDKDECLLIPKYISSFDLEQARLGQAMQSLKLDLNRLREKILKDLGEEVNLFLQSYFDILENPELMKQTLIKIRNESINAEWALENIADNYISESESVTIIFQDAISSLIYYLFKKNDKTIRQLTEPVVLVAKNFTILELTSINPNFIQGFLLESGDICSGASIFASILKIPAIVGLTNITSKIKNGDKVFIDGKNGIVVINPSTKQLENL